MSDPGSPEQRPGHVAELNRLDPLALLLAGDAKPAIIAANTGVKCLVGRAVPPSAVRALTRGREQGVRTRHTRPNLCGALDVFGVPRHRGDCSCISWSKTIDDQPIRGGVSAVRHTRIMARQEGLFDNDFAAEVIEVPVSDEMSESFLAYSLSVITSRAIPDVRDGLKPVQRRILYSMLNMGIRPDTPHRKSARVVGDTMGNYHPHGDSAIYDALVRMGQDFSRNLTLIDPQGNFGSLDDPPAAARYTECRLSVAAMEMLAEIDEDTVEFRGTYDGESIEPEYLPGKVPNLLVNGTTGIAVGMATNMAPHNLREVYEAIKLVMTKRRPKPTTDELMAVMPGPDFPSGGIIVDDTLRDAYENGRGSIRIRAVAQIEQVTAKKQGIVVTELPYLVGPEKVVSKINELLKAERLAGVTDVKNLSDLDNGTRILIECRQGVNPQAVLAQLYKLTPLEETFAVNNVVLVDGVPTTLSIHDLCQHYITHRLDVIVRRTQYRLERARARLHILDGLLIALDNIDLVIRIIRGSQTAADAREELKKQLDLSDIQATHILDMQLRRLVALERQKIVDERDEKVAEIAGYEQLLGSEQRQRTLVLKELEELADEHGHDRRSQIIKAEDIPVFDAPIEVAVDADVADEGCIVTLSTSGQIGREPTEGAKRATPGRHDLLITSCVTSTVAPVWAITSEGRALMVHAHELGEVAGRSRGSVASQVFGTNRGEDILTVSSQSTEDLMLVTQRGVAKRITAEELAGTKAGKTVINLKDGDRLIAAFGVPEGVDIVMVANDAQALRTAADQISVQGRNAGGVAGMKLKGSAQVIAAGAAIGDGSVVTVSDIGTAKATPYDEIPTKGRGGGGVRLTKFGKESKLTLAWVGALDNLLATMATDDDRTKPDPTPVAFPLEPSKRDLVSAETDRTILGVGPARW